MVIKKDKSKKKKSLKDKKGLLSRKDKGGKKGLVKKKKKDNKEVIKNKKLKDKLKMVYRQYVNMRKNQLPSGNIGTIERGQIQSRISDSGSNTADIKNLIKSLQDSIDKKSKITPEEPKKEKKEPKQEDKPLPERFREFKTSTDDFKDSFQNIRDKNRQSNITADDVEDLYNMTKKVYDKLPSKEEVFSIGASLKGAYDYLADLYNRYSTQEPLQDPVVEPIIIPEVPVVEPPIVEPVIGWGETIYNNLPSLNDVYESSSLGSGVVMGGLIGGGVVGRKLLKYRRNQDLIERGGDNLAGDMNTFRTYGDNLVSRGVEITNKDATRMIGEAILDRVRGNIASRAVDSVRDRLTDTTLGEENNGLQEQIEENRNLAGRMRADIIESQTRVAERERLRQERANLARQDIPEDNRDAMYHTRDWLERNDIREGRPQATREFRHRETERYVVGQAGNEMRMREQIQGNDARASLFPPTEYNEAEDPLFEDYRQPIDEFQDVDDNLPIPIPSPDIGIGRFGNRPPRDIFYETQQEPPIQYEL